MELHVAAVKVSSPVGIAIGVAAATDLLLKILAIRRAVQRGDRKWILPLAILNTVGVLPGCYLARRPKVTADVS